MPRKTKEPPFTDDRLRQIQDTVRGGLHKLVPCHRDVGWPPYTELGNINSPFSLGEEYDESVQGYLDVTLFITLDCVKGQWMCVLSIIDADDFCCQRWREFTLENWRDQLAVYNSLTQIDYELITLLRELDGFD